MGQFYDEAGLEQHDKGGMAEGPSCVPSGPSIPGKATKFSRSWKMEISLD